MKTLRHSLSSELSFDARPGYLRLHGGQSLGSLHEQSLLARRWQSTSFRAETQVEFSPRSFQQIAGLVCYFDTNNWQYLNVSFDEELGCKVLRLDISDNGKWVLVGKRPIEEQEAALRLGVRVNRNQAQFEAAKIGGAFVPIGEPTAADRLSDDYVKELGGLSFTGAFVGICAQDLDDHSSFADFRYFDYREFPGECA